MKVSFIVPVYNVEQYLEECVGSLIAQTYQDIEIILVDDGSPDTCPLLCDRLASADNRIRVLHKVNGGLSDARNAGLALAKGDYVVFVDSDDFWLGSDSLEKLVQLVEKNPECGFIGFNVSYYFQNIKSYRRWVPYPDSLSEPSDSNIAVQLLVSSGTVPMSACSKIISKELLVKNNLLFEKGIISEDIPWFINLLEKCGKCMFVNEYIYSYRQNVFGSITNTGGIKSYNSLFYIVKSEIEKIEERNFTKATKESLYSFLAYEYCIMLAMLKKCFDGKTRAKKREELKEYRWLLNYTENPKVRRVALVKKIFGPYVVEVLLRYYLKMLAIKRKS